MTARRAVRDLPRVAPGAVRLLAELTEAAATAPEPLPCQVRHEPFHSESAFQRSTAAKSCASCPLLELCDQYADAPGEWWGVWGGHDRTR